MFRSFTHFLLLFIMVGCNSEPAMDCSSLETFQSSNSAIRKSLSPEKDAVYEKAFTTIGFDRLPYNTDEMSGSILDIMEFGSGFGDTVSMLETGEVPENMKKRIEGKTADDIISAALARWQSTLDTLLQEKKQFEKDVISLEKFIIADASISQSSPIGLLQSDISMTATNQLDKAISKAYFRGVVKSPDREVPWIDESFSYEIPGGIEPNETLQWNLTLYGMDWKVELPKTATIEITTIQVDDASGNLYLGGTTWKTFQDEKIEQIQSWISAAQAL